MTASVSLLFGPIRIDDGQSTRVALEGRVAIYAAWVVVSLSGGLFATLLGYIRSPFGQAPAQDAMFLAWLHYPMAYWPWFVFGAVVAGLAFYAADLLTGAR